MNEKQAEQKNSPLSTGNAVLDTMFGQVLANQGVLTQ